MNDITVIPPIDELERLPTPLTPGESRVLALFLEQLPDGWEVYVQPHLNGLRPDFVLLHPENGIAVYEVKDWDLDALDYFFQGTPPSLHGRRDAKTFSLASQDPIAKVTAYKEEIHGLYCPSLPGQVGFGVITAGVVFPYASREKLNNLFGPPYKKHLAYPQNPLCSREDLESEDVLKFFPLLQRRNEHMTPEIATELRSWLVEPEVSIEQRRPLELDRRQRRLATGRTRTGYRRVKGPAGSGKSLVLAARAAELAKEGKTVLVATFNITLLNYLRDLAVRWWRGKAIAERITWLNFHQWCKRVAIAAGEREAFQKLWKDDDQEKDAVLNEKLAELVLGLYQREGTSLPKYDAILVDEGQDYRLSWWNALRAACKSGGEMLLVADPTQDLYATARAWTEQAMVGAGFPGGQWTTLDASYRLPPELIPLARDFAERFLPHDELRTLPQPAQIELSLARTHLRWFQVKDNRAEDACVAEVLGLPSSTRGATLPWADVTFLASSKAFGSSVVKRLEVHGVRVLHTFYDGQEERRRKLAFFKGAPKVKATTIHSFKGWEGRALVVHLGDLSNDQSKAAAYAALTRLKRHEEACVLSVVCAWDGAAEYGRSWPSFRAWPGDGLGVDSRVLEDFNAEWRPVVAALAASDGVTVEPGDEVMQGGRVVDLDLATVHKGTQALRLVDDSRSTSSDVASALLSQGHRALRVRASEPDVVARVLAALEE